MLIKSHSQRATNLNDWVDNNHHGVCLILISKLNQSFFLLFFPFFSSPASERTIRRLPRWPIIDRQEAQRHHIPAGFPTGPVQAPVLRPGYEPGGVPAARRTRGSQESSRHHRVFEGLALGEWTLVTCPLWCLVPLWKSKLADVLENEVRTELINYHRISKIN